MAVPPRDVQCITILDDDDDDDDVLFAAFDFDAAIQKSAEKITTEAALTPAKRKHVQEEDVSVSVLTAEAALSPAKRKCVPVEDDSEAVFIAEITNEIDDFCSKSTPEKSLQVLSALKQKVEEKIIKNSPKKGRFTFKRPILCSLNTLSPTLSSLTSLLPGTSSQGNLPPSQLLPALSSGNSSSPSLLCSNSSSEISSSSESLEVFTSSSLLTAIPTSQCPSSSPLDLQEFSGHRFAHSNSVLNVFHNVFNLEHFRPHQLESINAALLGHDCLIVMPTGGGKSLCYQIPAAVKNGLTVVVSPLKSLISDQMHKMKSVGIKSCVLSGDVSKSELTSIYTELLKFNSSIKLLYVTPETLLNSDRLKKCLSELYSRERLSRIVVDEAHCILQWGKDFRCDYGNLKTVRRTYSRVPLMALTASVSQTDMVEVINNLGMKNAKTFITSFNRPNLQYCVMQKNKNVMAELLDLLWTEYSSSSGIIYCLTRKDCEKTAACLSENGITTLPYHAGLSSKVRQTTQTAWMQNDVKAIAATIAFGMGIDKEDVRYVIHLSMSKSIEAYYQETGRAGRDGQLSKCITFYSFDDSRRLCSLIQNNSKKLTAIEEDMSRLKLMLEFLENKSECRRILLLKHFGEENVGLTCSETCPAQCDNCSFKEHLQYKDVSDVAKEVVAAVDDLCSNANFTIGHMVSVLKGSRIKKIVDAGHDNHAIHGKLSSWKKEEIESMLQRLVIGSYLKTVNVMNFLQIPTCYLKRGTKPITPDFKLTSPML